MVLRDASASKNSFFSASLIENIFENISHSDNTWEGRGRFKVLKSTPTSSVAEQVKLEELESYRLVEGEVDQVVGRVQFILHQRLPWTALVEGA